MNSARSGTGMSPHAGWAALAAATASSTSRAVECATVAITSPVAGSNTSSVAPPAVESSPSMSWRTTFGAVVVIGCSGPRGGASPDTRRGERAAGEELAVPGLAVERAVLHQHAAALEHDLGRAGDLTALVAGVVDAHVVGGRGQHPFLVGVEHDDVGVGPRRQGALLGVQPEHP